MARIYYFTCIASDGYKVVFSWNELFNTVAGNTVYIVTSKDHTSIEALDEKHTTDLHSRCSYRQTLRKESSIDHR